MQGKCLFNECDNFAVAGSLKCRFHRKRSRCIEEGCTNQVYARGHCVRHGGRPKCQHENCSLNQRIGVYCSRHAAREEKRTCSVPGCNKLPHARGICVGHGGGRYCKRPNCGKHAIQSGFCRNHYRSSFDFTMIEIEANEIEWSGMEPHVSENAISKFSIEFLLHDREKSRKHLLNGQY
ncbi:hypothetical protein AeMF1_016415 [Aphanomyces euteiches]|nr:hypothetical protein AeMF1_016415 [Aphanomyces euteiches]